MKALVVYCHPDPGSFSAAVKSAIIDQLEKSGAEIRLIDLYGEGFNPLLSQTEWQGYENIDTNADGVKEHTDAVLWCDTLIFVYPTWWYGHPAMLKGWLDRVLIPGVAFHMPEGGAIKPGLHNIRRLAVFTTCGASWWLTRFVGSPGRKIILRGIGLLCHPAAKKIFCAHYLMDSSTDASRARQLERVGRAVRRMARGGFQGNKMRQSDSRSQKAST